MKPFKILRLIFQALCISLFLASFVICGIDIEYNALFLASLIANIGIGTIATVGVFLLSATSDTAKRIGHGFTLSSFALGLTFALQTLAAGSSAAILMLVAVIMLALYYTCVLVIHIMQRNTGTIENPDDDIRIVRVREWKKLMEEGIISEEEYEVKRCQILGFKSDDKKKKA